jgi:hypothetical protein
MKNFTYQILFVSLLAMTGGVYAQQNETIETKQNKPDVEQNLRKGKSVLFLNDLGFGAGNGVFVSNLGLSYGCFVADKHLLRLDIYANYYSDAIQNYRTGLFYRYYFSHWKIKPFVEAGGGVGIFKWGLSPENEIYGFGMINAGAAIHVKKFGFELGIKTIYNDHHTAVISIMPSFGVSFTF